MYKCGNTIFGEIKKFQVRENNPQQMMVLPMKVIKNTPKNGIIWHVKHIFIYEQWVATMSVRIHRKKKVKVLMKNWFVKFIREKMRILHAKLLIKHS